MSQVMPDCGFVVTDWRVLPEVYHQAAKPMLAHTTNPIVTMQWREPFSLRQQASETR